MTNRHAAVTPELTIVLPVCNEETVLETAVRRIVTCLRTAGPETEILICENGSTDQTLKVARHLAIEYPEIAVYHLDTPNYGRALRWGIERAQGRLIALLNVDLVDLAFLQAGLRAIERADLVIGSKTLRGSDDQRPLLRRCITKSFNWLLQRVFRTALSDTHGNKVVRRHTVQPLVSLCRTDRWLFDTELLMLCERAQLTIIELPVTVDEVRGSRYSLWQQVPMTIVNLCILFWHLRIRPADLSAARSRHLPAPSRDTVSV